MSATNPPPSHPPAPRKVGKPPKLQDAMAAFVAAVANKSEEEITRLWVEEVQAFHDRNISYSSTRLYVSKYKRAVADALGEDHPAVEIVSLKTLTKLAKQAATIEAGSADEDEDVPPQVTHAERKLERSVHNTVGRKPKLQEFIVNFVNDLEYVDNDRELSLLWNKEFARHNERTDSTRKGYVSLYRSAIQERYKDSNPDLMELALDIVKVPDEISNRVRAQYLGRVVSQHRQLVGIVHWREIVDTGRELLRSSDPLRIGVGLLVVSGRRPFEIFTTARFDRAPLASGAKHAFEKWAVLFTGQAKTRAAMGSRFDEAFPIPVLAPAGDVIEALHRLRTSASGREWIGIHRDDFSREVRIGLRNLVPDLFGDLWPAYVPLTPKCFRSLYAEIAYRMFCSPAVSKPGYFAAILGHGAEDLTSSHSYFDYYLADGEQPAQDAAAAAAALERTRQRIHTELQHQARVGDEWAQEDAEDIAAWLDEQERHHKERP